MTQVSDCAFNSSQGLTLVQTCCLMSFIRIGLYSNCVRAVAFTGNVQGFTVCAYLRLKIHPKYTGR